MASKRIPKDVLAALVLLHLGSAAHAQTSTVWVGGSGLWSDPAKWNPDTFAPNNGNGGVDYNVGFNGGTITLDAGVTIEMFTQTAGTLTAPEPATLATNKLFSWTGGIIGGRATVSAAEGSEYAFLRESSGSPLTLAGELRASVTGGFQPSRDDTFIVLTSNRDLTGVFSNVTNGRRIVSGDGSGTFRVHYGPTSTYQKDSVVLSTFVSPLITPVTYAEWIDSFQMDPDFAGFEDDPDLDGIPNGLENFLGTHPLEANERPAFVSFSAPALTFHHSRSNNIATDILVIYEWSANLVDWHAAGEADELGNSAEFSETVLVDYDAPETDLIELVAAFIGETAPRRFARIRVELKP